MGTGVNTVSIMNRGAFLAYTLLNSYRVGHEAGDGGRGRGGRSHLDGDRCVLHMTNQTLQPLQLA
jgi:hypothetical protein